MARFILETAHPSGTNLGEGSFPIIHQCINTDKQTDHRLHDLSSFSFISSGLMVRLFARIYTQMNYQINFRSFSKVVSDE